MSKNLIFKYNNNQKIINFVIRSLLKNEKVDLKNSTNEIGGSSNDSFYGPKK